MRCFLVVAAVPPLLVAAACAQALDQGAHEPSLPKIIEQLTEQRGCDETLIARDPRGGAVLAVQLPGLLARSRDRALPFTEELSVDGEAAIVRLELGADLDHWCTDVIDVPPRIEAIWEGVSGALAVTVVERRERDDAGEAHSRFVPLAVTLRLGPILLQRLGAEDSTVTLPALELAATLGVPGGG